MSNRWPDTIAPSPHQSFPGVQKSGKLARAPVENAFFIESLILAFGVFPDLRVSQLNELRLQDVLSLCVLEMTSVALLTRSVPVVISLIDHHMAVSSSQFPSHTHVFF
jgi:hypothetical protein